MTAYLFSVQLACSADEHAWLSYMVQVLEPVVQLLCQPFDFTAPPRNAMLASGVLDLPWTLRMLDQHLRRLPPVGKTALLRILSRLRERPEAEIGNWGDEESLPTQWMKLLPAPRRDTITLMPMAQTVHPALTAVLLQEFLRKYTRPRPLVFTWAAIALLSPDFFGSGGAYRVDADSVAVCDARTAFSV